MNPGKHRILPAQDIEEQIAFYCHGSYPPTSVQLEAMLARFQFDVVRFPPEVLPSAAAHHDLRQIWLPAYGDEREARMLLHEAAEVLLTFEVAPQYRTIEPDAPHQTATVVELRAERSRLASKAREKHREMTREAERAIACIESVKRDPRRVRTERVHPAARKVERLAEDLVQTEEQIDRLSEELDDVDF